MLMYAPHSFACVSIFRNRLEIEGAVKAANKTVPSTIGITKLGYIPGFKKNVLSGSKMKGSWDITNAGNPEA